MEEHQTWKFFLRAVILFAKFDCPMARQIDSFLRLLRMIVKLAYTPGITIN